MTYPLQNAISSGLSQPTILRRTAHRHFHLKRSARQAIQKKSRFTYALSLLLSSHNRPYFWIWYSYLRWVDDLVDDTSNSVKEGLCLIDRQLQLIEQLYQGQIVSLHDREEYLVALREYDVTHGGALKGLLCDMLEAIKFELSHVALDTDYADLEANYEREVLSYLGAIAYFCGVDPKGNKPIGSSAALGAKLVHILRDFIPDMASGRINISRQELAAHRLDLKAIREQSDPVQLLPWVTTKARLAGNLLDEGFLETRSCSSFRYRLIVAILVGKYRAYLERLHRHRFLLTSLESISFVSFLPSIARNVARAFFRPKANDSRVLPRRIDPFFTATTLDHFGLICILHPCANATASVEIRNALRKVSMTPSAKRKMRRRFIIAYQLGRKSFEFVNRSLLSTKLAHRAGLLYAYWALSVIEFDRLLDQGRIPDSWAEKLTDAWLSDIASAVSYSRPTGSENFKAKGSVIEASQETSLFRLLASHFMRQLTLYVAESNNCGQRVSYSQFITQTSLFLAAQLGSRCQKVLCDAHDWAWYYTKVLNQKTLGFFLAPLPLWCCEAQELARLQELVCEFLALNKGFLHWQLLDDVADLDKDTMDGVVTAPGFVLLSQGSVAQAWLDSEAGRDGADGMQLSHRMLLCDWFRDSPLLDSQRYLLVEQPEKEVTRRDTQSVAVRCALANTASELVLSLPELCATRVSQARAYAEAMKDRDWAAAHQRLTESRASERIMLAVHDDARTVAVTRQLMRVADKSLLAVLQILELLMAHAYRKAMRIGFHAAQAS